jgi:3-oxoacyl-[acyl-carrier-protein] synthase-3
MPALMAMFAAGLKEVARHAQLRTGLQMRDMNRCAFSFGDWDAYHEQYIDPLELDAERTSLGLGLVIGHGPGDPVIALDYWMQTDRLVPGDRCRLVGLGAGLTWTVVQLKILRHLDHRARSGAAWETLAVQP